MKLKFRFFNNFLTVIIILIVGFFKHSAFARDIDSLADTIAYNSEEERKAIKDFNEGNKDYFLLFYLASGDNNIQDAETSKHKFYSKIEKYKMSPYSGMKPSKFSKTIYKDIHKEYFSKYKLSISFSEIFKDGSYNCVTASALFALCFEELHLEYDIRLLPQHVFLVLFPEKEAIKVETTNPIEGLFVPNQRLMRQYVLFLKELKLISEEEYNTKSTDELFQEYYYAQESISVENLIGVHYFNSGLSYFQEEDFMTAFNQFEKAIIFYPDEIVKFMVKLTLQNLIYSSGMKSVEDVSLLVKYPKYSVSEQDKEMTVELFKLFTNEMIIKTGDQNSYTKGFNYIKTHLKDTLLMEEISFIYYFETGRYYYRTGLTVKSEEYFENSFQLRPDNVDAQTALIDILSQQMRYKSVKTVLAKTEKYNDQYEQLRENNAFLSLYASIALTAASESYGLNNQFEGKRYLDQFEKIYTSDMEINTQLISDTYISVAVYYFGRGNKSMASHYINRGLNYAPGNYRLMQLKKSF